MAAEAPSDARVSDLQAAPGDSGGRAGASGGSTFDTPSPASAGSEEVDSMEGGGSMSVGSGSRDATVVRSALNMRRPKKPRMLELQTPVCRRTAATAGTANVTTSNTPSVADADAPSDVRAMLERSTKKSASCESTASWPSSSST